MTEYPPLDGESLLGALVEGGVEFIVIGGVAVVGHGYQRTTKDIDIVPESSRGNLERLVRVLDQLDYRLVGTEEFDQEELVLPTIENLEAGGNWVLITRFGGFDILQSVEPDMNYAALAVNAVEDHVFGMPVRICGYEDLVAMKTSAGRPQDIADLERLRVARGE